MFSTPCDHIFIPESRCTSNQTITPFSFTPHSNRESKKQLNSSNKLLVSLTVGSWGGGGGYREWLGGGYWSRREGKYCTPPVPWNPRFPSTVRISGPSPHTTKYSNIRAIFLGGERNRGEERRDLMRGMNQVEIASDLNQLGFDPDIWLRSICCRWTAQEPDRGSYQRDRSW